MWYAPALKAAPYPSKEEEWLFKHLLSKNIAIAGIDVGESHGNPEGRRLFSVFHSELISKMGLATKPCLLGRSRGGLMLFNWASENPTKVACIAGIFPVLDFRTYPGIEAASQAYGMTVADLSTRLREHNPIERLRSLAEENIPIFTIHGDSDPIVPLDRNSQEALTLYRSLGGEMTLSVVKGEGHNLSPKFFRSKQLLDFLLSHL